MLLSRFVFASSFLAFPHRMLAFSDESAMNFGTESAIVNEA